jgi:hypothetical protein
MYRALANSLLSLLILTTFVWGGCVSCEQYFMVRGAKSCCAANGRCKTKTPVKQSLGGECKQIAFDYQKSVAFSVDLPVVAFGDFELPLVTEVAFTVTPRSNPIEPSPPDLQVLHSTFLI